MQDALHLVQYEEDEGRRAPKCPNNPAELVCSCKNFRHIGICSHVLVMNHLLGATDVLHVTGDISGGRRFQGGYRKGLRPAFEKKTSGAQTRRLN